MRTPVRVRELTAEEAEAGKRSAHPRMEPAGSNRAKIEWLSHAGKSVPAIAEELRCTAAHLLGSCLELYHVPVREARDI